MSKPWSPSPIDNVVIVGTGACEGSWTPVREAILEVDETACLHVHTSPSHPDYDLETRAANEAANFWLADLVHRRRRLEVLWAFSPEQFQEQTGQPLEKFQPFREKVEAARQHLADCDRHVKEAIVARLRHALARGNLRVRPEFWTAMSNEHFEGSLWYATTNWDLALETTAEKELGVDFSRVHHIHGSTSRPDRLFLPSEVLEEPYRSTKDRDAVIQSVLLSQPLSWTRQICLYGLGISVSDAELAQTLEMGFEQRNVEPGTVLIYNLASALPALERKIRRLSKGQWKIKSIPVESLTRKHSP